MPNLPSALKILISTGLLLSAGSALAWSPSLIMGVEGNDNVNKSIREEKTDFALTASVDFSTLQIINRDWQLSYGGRVQTSAWQEYSGLNLTEIGAHSTLRRKLGLGPYALRMELSAEVSHQLSKVEEWSGNWLRVGATLRKRFSPLWEASLHSIHQQLDAKRGVYSTANITTSATINFDPTEEWRISLLVGYANGEHLSWCRNSWDSFVGTTQWLDGIFGDDWFPYQATGHTTIGSISVLKALGPNSTLALEYKETETNSPKNHVYRDQIISLQFIHAF